jgi:hypothetical protein
MIISRLMKKFKNMNFLMTRNIMMIIDSYKILIKMCHIIFVMLSELSGKSDNMK